MIVLQTFDETAFELIDQPPYFPSDYRLYLINSWKKNYSILFRYVVYH